MGRSLLIRDRELVSTDIFMGWVLGLLFSGSLEADERLSKYEIRSRPHLGGIGFGIFIGVPLIYGAFVYVALFLGLCPSYTETSLLIIIFAVQKKNSTHIYIELHKPTHNI
ncbi:hypothetical protein QL285_056243 [Trifolium repens]|nr:hypothetical protein QL285_056243 [Trifolium repens]